MDQTLSAGLAARSSYLIWMSARSSATSTQRWRSASFTAAPDMSSPSTVTRKGRSAAARAGAQASAGAIAAGAGAATGATASSHHSLMSTRRFWAMPWGLSLLATGWVWPWPLMATACAGRSSCLRR
ncbi:hypothetical protein D3C78_1389910 [compost metagenome]